MKRLLWVTASALSLALVSAGFAFSSSTSHRAEIFSDPAAKSKPVVGLVLKYKDGVVAKDIFGNQVALSSELNQGEDLGLGMYSANFEAAVSESAALDIANSIAGDSRIETIYFNHFLPKPSATKPSYSVPASSSAA